VAALAVGYHLARAERQVTYLAAMEKYFLFVTEGCDKPPTNPAKAGATSCPPKGSGWVIESGKNKGALGDGWYMKQINLTPYTISTATTGSCAFVELDVIKPSALLKTIATDAVRWIINQMLPDGKIPYILTPASDNGHTTFQPITYSTESFIDLDLRYPGAKNDLLPLKKTVLWLVGNQSKDGHWGDLHITPHIPTERLYGVCGTPHTVLPAQVSFQARTLAAARTAVSTPASVPPISARVATHSAPPVR
jgi:hypothetical protein